MDNEDLRDRVTRAEQNIMNQRENFASFKQDDFGSLKREVHSMRAEMSAKLDELLTKINNINLTIAKYVGMGTVLLVIAEFALKKFFG